ncbi:hypothetical protein GCM10025868_20210 [Angustibacter aerolatus]|uniref:Uncharacterized protein n=1 Tax=Angustibacter aerolatus TaxID=1162965 RepID=A0ABQ6JEZ6_9ACTN|nr:hypothetical protein GCM10025868_20210 [Angustibacter aerolatus]
MCHSTASDQNAVLPAGPFHHASCSSSTWLTTPRGRIGTAPSHSVPIGVDSRVAPSSALTATAAQYVGTMRRNRPRQNALVPPGQPSRSPRHATRPSEKPDTTMNTETA